MSKPLQLLQLFLQHMGLSVFGTAYADPKGLPGDSTLSTRHATTATTALSTSADRTGIYGPSCIIDSGLSISLFMPHVHPCGSHFRYLLPPKTVSHRGAITTTGRFFVLSVLDFVPKLSIHFSFC